MRIRLTFHQNLNHFQIALSTSHIQGRLSINIHFIANELRTALCVHMAFGVILDEETHPVQVRGVAAHQVAGE
jgi:hypothetical protein